MAKKKMQIIDEKNLAKICFEICDIFDKYNLTLLEQQLVLRHLLTEINRGINYASWQKLQELDKELSKSGFKLEYSVNL